LIRRRGTVDLVTDPLALSEELTQADARLQATIAGLTEASLGEPSLLPGWTRGHVLSHIARNADALGNLLIWARTGVETRAYASLTARAEGIEAGANRPLAEQIDDIRTSAVNFAKNASEMPPSAWSVDLGPHGSATKVIWRRLREVEIHHVDLDAGYTPADWPESFTHRLLHELVKDRRLPSGDATIAIQANELAHPLHVGAGTPATTVAGQGHELAAWLTGRSLGSSLTVSPPGPLPGLTDWM
jgi:maleylpyruvate isomerase